MENRERSREINRAYRQRHPDRVKTQNINSYRRYREERVLKMRNYYLKNRERTLEKMRLYNHKVRLINRNMTQQKYDELDREQQHKCAICRKPFELTPHIDHNHKTRKTRGLLCAGCNGGLGLFKDNSHSLKNAIKYLRKYAEV